jgi:aspartate aminotransferase
MNELLKNISGAKNVEYADFVREYEAKNKTSILKLQTGDPDFSTHPNVVKAMLASIEKGKTHYTNSPGIPDLRSALSEKLVRENKINSAPENILVANGGVHAIYLAIRSLINPGDKVIIFEPYWMPYKSILEISGANIIKVPLDLPHMNEETILNNFKKAYSNDVKLIIANSPNNPTGMIFSENFYKDLLNTISNETILLSDEVYEKILYDKAVHVSPASLGIKSEQIISVFSFSKTYAMTGWRIGYLHASKVLNKEMLKLLQYTSTCVSPFIQDAAIVALKDNAVNAHVDEMVKRYAERRNLLIELKGAVMPKGAFYCLIQNPTHLGEVNFSRWCVENIGVAVSPGDAFGENLPFFRVSFAVDDTTWSEGIKRLSTVLKG